MRLFFIVVFIVTQFQGSSWISTLARVIQNLNRDTSLKDKDVVLGGTDREIANLLADHLEKIRRQVAQRLRFYSNTYETIHYDERCAGTSEILFQSSSVTLRECKDRCSLEFNCGFIAYWRSKYCEIYVKCNVRTNLGYNGKKLQNVQIFKRLTECDVEFYHGGGPLVKKVSETFPKGYARYNDPYRNLHCKCITGRWGVCTVFMEHGSKEEDFTAKLLDRNNLKAPFKTMDMIDPQYAPVILTTQPKEQLDSLVLVYAEITYMDPSHCIHISLCRDGTPNGFCPVIQSQFESGDAVYILKSDREKVSPKDGSRPRGVPCISSTGFRALSMTVEDDYATIKIIRFLDPFHREFGKLRGIEEYEIYYVFDDERLNSGICHNPPAYGLQQTILHQKKPQHRKDKKKRNGRNTPSTISSPSQSSQSELPNYDELSNLDEEFQQTFTPTKSPIFRRPGTPEFDDPDVYFRKFEEKYRVREPIQRPGTPEFDDPEAYFTKMRLKWDKEEQHVGISRKFTSLFTQLFTFSFLLLFIYLISSKLFTCQIFFTFIHKLHDFERTNLYVAFERESEDFL